MKKFLSIIAASAVVIAASTSVAGTQSSLRNYSPRKAAMPSVKMKSSIPSLESAKKTLKEIRKADDATLSLEGSWTFTFGDVYFADSEGTFIFVDYNATLDGDTLRFKSADGIRYDFNGYYDAEKKTVTFGNSFVGISDGYYVYQQPFRYDYNSGELIYVNALVGTYFPDLALLTFDVDGLAWEAFQGSKKAGYMDILDFAAATFNDADIDEGEWEDVGNATFKDGWILPYFNIDQNANKYEVPLQQSVTDKNVYRLVNPYMYGLPSTYNDGTGEGYIVFDVTDPDHVVFKLADAGFANLELGITSFYCFNQLGMLAANYPEYSLEDIITLQEGYSPWTTFKDGCVVLSSIVTPNGFTTYDANFGLQIAPLGGLCWSTSDGSPLNMDAMIVFPGYSGVDSMIEEGSDLPVEYFNLQGVRVVNPQAGQIVISRRGTSVAKEIIK